MKNILSKTPLSVFFIILLFWIALIPIAEIGVNNTKSVFSFVPIQNKYVSETLSEEQKLEYQKSDINKELEEIREMMLIEHKKEESTLSVFLSQDTIRDLDILSHIDILGFFFINKYPIELTKKSDYRNISYYRDMSSYGDIGYNFFTESGQKLHDRAIDHSSIINEVAERYRNPLSIPFVYEEVLKIGTDNEELIDRIKSVVYKKYIDDVSYIYGYSFIILYIFAFTFFAWALELKYVWNNIPKKERNKFNIASFTERNENLSTISFIRTQPAFTVNVVLGIIFALLLLGLLSGIFEIYFSNFDSVKKIGVFDYLVTPLNELAHFIGSSYISNIPSSRFVLILLMPISLVVYMHFISAIDKIVKEYNKMQR